MMVGQLSLFAVLAVVLVAEVANALPPQKIMGGEAAAPGEFPYQVSLRIDGRHACGGTIISKRHIVTSAQCVINLPSIYDLVVVTGSLSSTHGGQCHQTQQIVYHPDFNRQSTGPNDIAIVALASVIDFNAYQNMLYLPATRTPSGVLATVTGWGWVSPKIRSNVEYLRKLSVRTITAEECQRYATTVLYTHQMCAHAGPGRGSCMADSGGPLARDGVLIGVVSYGNPCGTGIPDVFTSTYHYVDWIRYVVANS